MTTRRAVFVCTAAAVATAAEAQQPLPIRPLGPIVHVTTERLASVANVRQLPDGRLLVNDITAHRVLLFDSTLATATVVADATPATAKAYGARPGTLIAYHADSTLFVDPSSLSMLVIDASGRIVRVLSAPRAEDVPYLIGSINGAPGFDARGRLVYRGTARGSAPPTPPGVCPIPLVADSAPIVRFDFGTRTLDTAAQFRIPSARPAITCDARGNITTQRHLISPFQLVDAWGMLPDGSLAVVRGREYRVEWVNLDGTRTLSPRIPFDWKHLSDDDKAAILDSAKTAFAMRFDSSAAARQARQGGNPPPTAASARGAVSPEASANAAASFIEVRDLPDYVPPFAADGVHADADGCLWIRTSTMVNGRPVYDIVSRQGNLIDRLVLPPFRTIAGFGHGVVYMAVLDSARWAHVEQARVK
jgi:hypothetical protein